jgi:AcrR family transcriptional regulator
MQVQVEEVCVRHQRSSELTKAPSKREGTDRSLERAALRILTGGGLLAGLTLQQVGDEAGVAKGLVYHYFGDRRALLRSALRHGAMELQDVLRAVPDSSYDRRVGAFAKAALVYPAAVQLMTLLLIDRDPRLRPMPLRGLMMQDFERDVRKGRLPADADFEALLGVQNSLVYGYILFRDGLARQMGVERDVLDARFRRLVPVIGRRAAIADWSNLPRRFPSPSPRRMKAVKADTRGLLAAAAVELLDEQGILAGVNLRAVAERAGVHRGLVYHHFGSRREMLLAALRMYLPDAGPVTSDGGVPGDCLYAAGVRDNQPVRLMALLALDGDDSYEPFGKIVDCKRPTTRQMAGACLALGHALYRQPFASEMGIPQKQWDRRVFSAWALVAPD